VDLERPSLSHDGMARATGTNSRDGSEEMERDKRIELSPPPWQGGVLPLYESRLRNDDASPEAFIACRLRRDKTRAEA
jgi:hypothetical protein